MVEALKKQFRVSVLREDVKKVEDLLYGCHHLVKLKDVKYTGMNDSMIIQAFALQLDAMVFTLQKTWAEKRISNHFYIQLYRVRYALKEYLSDALYGLTLGGVNITDRTQYQLRDEELIAVKKYPKSDLMDENRRDELIKQIVLGKDGGASLPRGKVRFYDLIRSTRTVIMKHYMHFYNRHAYRFKDIFNPEIIWSNHEMNELSNTLTDGTFIAQVDALCRIFNNYDERLMIMGCVKKVEESYHKVMECVRDTVDVYVYYRPQVPNQEYIRLMECIRHHLYIVDALIRQNAAGLDLTPVRVNDGSIGGSGLRKDKLDEISVNAVQRRMEQDGLIPKKATAND